MIEQDISDDGFNSGNSARENLPMTLNLLSRITLLLLTISTSATPSFANMISTCFGVLVRVSV